MAEEFGTERCKAVLANALHGQESAEGRSDLTDYLENSFSGEYDKRFNASDSFNLPFTHCIRSAAPTPAGSRSRLLVVKFASPNSSAPAEVGDYPALEQTDDDYPF